MTTQKRQALRAIELKIEMLRAQLAKFSDDKLDEVCDTLFEASFMLGLVLA